MGSLLYFGRLYMHTLHQHAGGPFFCATRFGQKALYRHLGMKLLRQPSSKRGIPLVVEIRGLFIDCSWLQNICCNFVTEVERRRCRRSNLAYTIWFSFWLRLCGCTLHCKAEGGKCMGPEKRKLASPGPGLGQSFRFHFSYKFGQCNVQCRVSVFHIISVRWSVAFTMGGTSWCEMETAFGQVGSTRRDSTSRQHPECFGISQGCPLSPFLFSIVLTLLIQDAKAAFPSRRDRRSNRINQRIIVC